MGKKEILEVLLKKDKYRLNYHLMPAKGLLNDPNGLVEKDNKYHVFYQWNDKECAHGPKKWGHYISKNFIDWEIEDVAIDPVEYYETHGCYSGSGIVIDDKINLIYTGNVKSHEGSRESFQCLAVEREDGSFEKKGPIIKTIPEGYTGHFRDPKIWKENEMFYMVLGAQNNDLKGEVLLYKSESLNDWELVGSIYEKNDLGYMMECPDLFEFNNKKILVSSPQGLEPKGELYNNIFQSGYMVGRVNYSTAENEWSEFIEIDRGFDFYAPQTFLDSRGRRIMYAWMGMEEEGHPTIKEENWVHALTMPREITLEEDKLIQRPLEEMKSLRLSSLNYENMVVQQSLSLDGVKGNSFELIVELENIDSTIFGIKLRKNKTEELVVKFEKNELIVDREKTLGLKGTRKCQIEGVKHKLHVFMDTTSMELFYNDGQEVFTSRVFFSENDNEIEFFSENGEILIKNLEFYNLKSYNYFVE